MKTSSSEHQESSTRSVKNNPSKNQPSESIVNNKNIEQKLEVLEKRIRKLEARVNELER